MFRELTAHELGPAGEALAEKFLKERGYRILHADYRSPAGQIDFVCEDGGTLVFVEVKARRDLTQGRPEEAVHGAKQRRLYRTAEWFLAEANYTGERPVRFDVVAICLDARHDSPEIELFRDAFSL